MKPEVAGIIRGANLSGWKKWTLRPRGFRPCLPPGRYNPKILRTFSPRIAWVCAGSNPARE